MAGDELLVILTKGGFSFFFSSVNLGGLSEFFDGAALDIVTACFTFGYNFMSTVTNELLNDMGIESIVIANANAFPWASPNYDPLSSSNKKNINAIPWSSPDYSPS